MTRSIKRRGGDRLVRVGPDPSEVAILEAWLEQWLPIGVIGERGPSARRVLSGPELGHSVAPPSEGMCTRADTDF